MIVKDHTKYETEKYKKLEELKVRIKDMQEVEDWYLLLSSDFSADQQLALDAHVYVCGAMIVFPKGMKVGVKRMRVFKEDGTITDLTHNFIVLEGVKIMQEECRFINRRILFCIADILEPEFKSKNVDVINVSDVKIRIKEELQKRKSVLHKMVDQQEEICRI